MLSRLVNLAKTEPVLVVSAVEAVLALLGGTVLALTASETGAVLAVTTAALALVAALATTPFQVSALTGFVAAVVTLLMAFGVPHIDPGIVSTLNAAIVAVFAIVVRLHVSPVASLAKRAPAVPPVITPAVTDPAAPAHM